MPGNLTQALVYIIDAIGTIILAILLLRFMLPFLRADFRNPVAQAILKVTSPIVVPVRRIVPSIGRLDTTTILLTFLLQMFVIWLTLTLYGASASLTFIAFEAVKRLLVLSIQIFMFAIVVRIIISWIAPGQHTPLSTIVSTISEPLLAPLRRLIPPLGGFDISPMIALIMLGALTIIVGGIPPMGM